MPQSTGSDGVDVSGGPTEAIYMMWAGGDILSVSHGVHGVHFSAQRGESMSVGRFPKIIVFARFE